MVQDAHNIDFVRDDAIEYDMRADGVFAIADADMVAILASARIGSDDVEGSGDVAHITFGLVSVPVGLCLIISRQDRIARNTRPRFVCSLAAS